MYAFISGNIEEKGNNIVVLNCNGIGYELYVGTNTIASLPAIGDFIKIYTYLHVREDAQQLFGFKTKEEKKMFLELITVSGVGAKTAMSVLSSMTVNDLMTAFAYGDASMLSKVKGLGKKTAERIVVDLKGKFSGIDLSAMPIMNMALETDACAESIELLITMGLTRFDATAIVKRVFLPDDTTEQIVAKALKQIG